MGVASDSFIMIVSWAGFVTVLFLVYSLVTRARRGRGDRGVFQRMPLLLPAIAFVISVFIIMQMRITPIQEYHGNNILDYYLYDGAELDYRVYKPGIAYVEETTLTISSILQPNESIIVVLDFSLKNEPIENLTISLVAEENESTITQERILNLDPGNYVILTELTFYENGMIVDSYDAVELVLSQRILSSIYPELLEWSTLQFMLNVACFFFIIGGLCVGQEDKKLDRRVDDYDDKTSSDEYRSYDL